MVAITTPRMIPRLLNAGVGGAVVLENKLVVSGGGASVSVGGGASVSVGENKWMID